MELLSIILNVVLGSGFIASLITLRSTKKTAGAKAQQAVAEARANELKNVESAITIWRQIAENMSAQYQDLSEQVEALRKEVRRLNSINNKTLKLLEKVNSENIEVIVEQIKKIMNEVDS